MKIGIIQASSQINKNELVYNTAMEVTKEQNYEILNFGCFPDEKEKYSYIEIALEVSLLLSSGAVNFMITGCSSGQGMMLACNSCPGVTCGYVENPQDAFLFGRINDGNAVSLPLALNFGWSGEINLKCTLERLFDGPFGCGYPEQDAERKRHDTQVLKQIHAVTQKKALDVYEAIMQSDVELCYMGDNAQSGVEDMKRALLKALSRRNVVEYILQHGTDSELVAWVRENDRLIHADGSKSEN